MSSPKKPETELTSKLRTMQGENGEKEDDEELPAENKPEEDNIAEVDPSQPSEGSTVMVEFPPENKSEEDILNKVDLLTVTSSGVVIVECPPEGKPQEDPMHQVDIPKSSLGWTVHVELPPEDELVDPLNPADLPQSSPKRTVCVDVCSSDEPEEDPIYEVNLPRSSKLTSSKKAQKSGEKSPSRKSSEKLLRSPSASTSLHVSPERSKKKSKSETNSLSPKSPRSSPKCSPTRKIAVAFENFKDSVKSKIGLGSSTKQDEIPLLDDFLTSGCSKKSESKSKKKDDLENKSTATGIWYRECELLASDTESEPTYSTDVSSTSDVKDPKNEKIDLPEKAIKESKQMETDDEQQTLSDDDTESPREKMLPSFKISAEECSDEPSTSREESGRIHRKKKTKPERKPPKDPKDEASSSPAKKPKRE